ncbi:MAG: T9SS type A sorting domain-containing protein [Calditrichales bacterium]|nr:MAG: T9SS type A sorting domain-containing protein [Calditrichales bacterium]
MQVIRLVVFGVFISWMFVSADTIYVPGDETTIQNGISAAQKGDTVIVDEGGYYENLFFINKSIVVGSRFLVDGDTTHISRTIIFGSNPTNPDYGSVAYFYGCTDQQVLCQLSGFTITGGSGTIYRSSSTSGREGGGIVVYESDVCISNNRITGNTVQHDINGFGAGISVFMNSASVRKMIIRDNQITSNMLLTDNGGGGGIYLGIHNFDLLLENNRIIDNRIESISGGSTTGMGAGIFYEINLPDSGTHQIGNNIISSNNNFCSKSFGGGIHFTYWDSQSTTIPQDPNTRLYNNIISENYSQYMGGAISVIRNNIRPENRNFLKQPVLLNNTLVQNEALRGSGVFMLNAVPIILNTIIQNRKAPNTGSEIYGIGENETVLKVFNLYGDVILANVIVDDPKWTNIEYCIYNTDPQLRTSMCQLCMYSPCIGMGLGSFNIDGRQFDAPVNDINGNPRPSAADIFVDIGAIESPYPAVQRPLKLSLDKTYLQRDSDLLNIAALISSPHQKKVRVFAKIYDVTDSLIVGSVELFDNGMHSDNDSSDDWYGGSFILPEIESTFEVSEIQIDDAASEYSLVYGIKNNNRFTSKGPFVVSGHTLMHGDTIPQIPGIFRIKLLLENTGYDTEVKTVSAHVRSLVPWAEIIFESNPTYGNIMAGEAKETKGWYRVEIKSNSDPEELLAMEVVIAEDGFEFWESTYDLPLPVTEISSNFPMNYSLRQNYPNPFNPETRIDFSIPEKSFVSLVILNVLGQEVAKLEQKNLMPGSYSYKWDASGFASGVYVCSFQANNYSDNKKLILIK